jgi:hypothetical protein
MEGKEREERVRRTTRGEGRSGREGHARARARATGRSTKGVQANDG